MTASFHKYGDFFPGTGDVRVRPSLPFSLGFVSPRLHLFFSSRSRRTLDFNEERTTPSTCLYEMVSAMKLTRGSSNLFVNKLSSSFSSRLALTHHLSPLLFVLQIIRHIMEWYRPGAIVLQCGADSLAGDKLGVFNLSMKGSFTSSLYSALPGKLIANSIIYIRSFRQRQVC